MLPLMVWAATIFSGLILTSVLTYASCTTARPVRRFLGWSDTAEQENDDANDSEQAASTTARAKRIMSHLARASYQLVLLLIYPKDSAGAVSPAMIFYKCTALLTILATYIGITVGLVALLVDTTVGDVISKLLGDPATVHPGVATNTGRRLMSSDEFDPSKPMKWDIINNMTEELEYTVPTVTSPPYFLKTSTSNPARLEYTTMPPVTSPSSTEAPTSAEALNMTMEDWWKEYGVPGEGHPGTWVVIIMKFMDLVGHPVTLQMAVTIAVTDTPFILVCAVLFSGLVVAMMIGILRCHCVAKTFIVIRHKNSSVAGPAPGREIVELGKAEIFEPRTVRDVLAEDGPRTAARHEALNHFRTWCWCTGTEVPKADTAPAAPPTPPQPPPVSTTITRQSNLTRSNHLNMKGSIYDTYRQDELGMDMIARNIDRESLSSMSLPGASGPVFYLELPPEETDN